MAGNKPCEPGCTCGLHRPWTDEHRQHHSEAITQAYAEGFSEEHRQKISESLTRAYAENPALAQRVSKAVSKAVLGRFHFHSEEHRRKIGAGNRRAWLNRSRRCKPGCTCKRHSPRFGVPVVRCGTPPTWEERRRRSREYQRAKAEQQRKYYRLVLAKAAKLGLKHD